MKYEGKLFSEKGHDGTVCCRQGKNPWQYEIKIKKISLECAVKLLASLRFSSQGGNLIPNFSQRANVQLN